jgi:Flp pilus assembly protein TadD
VRLAAILLTLVMVALAGCGSSSTDATTTTGSGQAEQDQRDSSAIQRQVNEQVDEQARTAITEAETASGVESSRLVRSETICTKQSDTAYKCLTTFTQPPSAPNVVTGVTCDRDGANCITESK